ncbi:MULTISPECIES: hypothetical protein [Streptomyces]|uniref:Uncharacterized protein n=2 Tax=Streptomyces TaxID=1883 RepID=A0A117IWW2_9ACTN|nr:MULTISPECIES: hypothetical protein [Streptomyces]KUH38782.1 hypothetical protein ATE80_10945 [Streptomyces kanasensis]UUS34417.1 hypothetical protein NRO40_28730 [Streptomyces changanensis]
MDIAGLRVGHAPFLAPGGRGTVRLTRLGPARWWHVRPGRLVTPYQGRSAAGTAVIPEVHSQHG